MKHPFQAQKEVSFFLRIHRHLPDKHCGGFTLGRCHYRKDEQPINMMNGRVSELQLNHEFAKKEQEVKDAVHEILCQKK